MGRRLHADLQLPPELLPWLPPRWGWALAGGRGRQAALRSQSWGAAAPWSEEVGGEKQEELESV